MLDFKRTLWGGSFFVSHNQNSSIVLPHLLGYSEAGIVGSDCNM